MARLEHGATMRRREFIAGVGAYAVMGPCGAWGQQSPMPVIGFLSARARGESAHLVDPFRRGLAEHGLIEGQNLVIDYRWADGHYDRLPPAGNRICTLAGDGAGRGWRRYDGSRSASCDFHHPHRRGLYWRPCFERVHR